MKLYDVRVIATYERRATVRVEAEDAFAAQLRANGVMFDEDYPGVAAIEWQGLYRLVGSRCDGVEVVEDEHG